MPQPVNAGSVLGGRYKVTAQVLASAENDLVLDGVDQVLNRAVSILVAAPQNATQVSASAREIAIGERQSTVQILDLGVSDGRTYLVTSSGNAADLLDLVIERDAPYVEPFFTDTLGSEIFGVARSREPETVEEDRYVEDRPDRKPLLSGLSKPHLPRFGRGAGAAAGGAAAGAASAAAARDLEYGGAQEAPAEAATGAASIPPPPRQSPKGSAQTTPARTVPAGEPKVSRWDEEDDFPAEGYAAAGQDTRQASSFPRTALDSDYDSGDYDDDERDEDDGAGNGNSRKFGRLLVGAILSLILIVAVVFSFTSLGKVGDFFAANPEPTPSAEAPSTTEGAPAETGTALPAPATAGVTRLVPGNQELDSANDAALPQIVDGNAASYWSSYVYASDTFGGLAPSLALVVELEEESAITKVDITQLNGSGGSFSVMLNDSPSLDGAQTVAQSGFTGPETSITVPKVDGEPVSASYVIINFTQLPRLSGVQAEYPWGLRIAEIAVS
ncbi:discoidin domain-containing protein [Arthrobacter sp. zg-Y916]|uniref:discoidin domain-containing protein n=1 Tax=Arthrobacter sp. zg-Y916 TaxID=2894190 RepID=UPI001E5BEFED|nr:discoidin domain-containing protein [Arthrobacter sp. zg-Y916]MCC9194768.1 discoidin domain-containing protein [Arthrobacter sp. zg-Y916]